MECDNWPYSPPYSSPNVWLADTLFKTNLLCILACVSKYSQGQSFFLPSLTPLPSSFFLSLSLIRSHSRLISLFHNQPIFLLMYNACCAPCYLLLRVHVQFKFVEFTCVQFGHGSQQHTQIPSALTWSVYRDNQVHLIKSKWERTEVTICFDLLDSTWCNFNWKSLSVYTSVLF